MHFIYRTTCLVNGKTYIGQHKHNCNDKYYLGSGVIIKKAIKKYGKDNFVREILQDNLTSVGANFCEKLFISTENPEMNIAKGGQVCGWNKEVKMSDEQKRKLSMAHLNSAKKHNSGRRSGYKHTEEWKKEISKRMKEQWSSGKRERRKSEMTKQKMSLSFKGRHWKVIDGKRVWI